MASKTLASTTLLLFLNLLFFTLVSSTYVPCPPPPPKTPKNHHHHHNPSPRPANATCPKATIEFGVFGKLLNDLLHLIVGTPAKTRCCNLIGDLSDLEAAHCLCTAMKANLLGVNLNFSISLSLLLNSCEKEVPIGFQCA